MAPVYLYILTVMNMDYYSDSNPRYYLNVYVSGYKDTRMEVLLPSATVPDIYTLDTYNDWQWEDTFHFDSGPQYQAAVEKGIRITSSEAISTQVSAGVHANVFMVGYTAFPLTDRSVEFFLSSRPDDGPPRAISEADPVFIVGTGSEASTINVYRKKGDASSLVLSESIDREQMKEFTYDSLGQSWTGFYVNATEPVVVYSGHQCADVPRYIRRCKPILQQLPPVTDIGNIYIAGPIASRGNAGYTLRAIFTELNTDVELQQPSTNVWLDPIGAYPKCNIIWDNPISITCNQAIEAGDFLDFRIGNAEYATFIKCSRPCYVFQFNHGGTLHVEDSARTDPFMALVPPANMATKEVRFSTVVGFHNSISVFLDHYVTIIAPHNHKIEFDRMRLDEDDIVTRFDHWTVYKKDPGRDFHNVTSNGGSTASLAVQVYGHGYQSRFDFDIGYGFAASYASGPGAYINDYTNYTKILVPSVVCSLVVLIVVAVVVVCVVRKKRKKVPTESGRDNNVNVSSSGDRQYGVDTGHAEIAYQGATPGGNYHNEPPPLGYQEAPSGGNVYDEVIPSAPEATPPPTYEEALEMGAHL